MSNQIAVSTANQIRLYYSCTRRVCDFRLHLYVCTDIDEIKYSCTRRVCDFRLRIHVCTDR